MSQISFNVAESIANSYLSASRWKFTNPALTDNQVMAKGLKIYVKDLISEYNRFLVYGNLQSNYNELNISSSIIHNKDLILRQSSQAAKIQLDIAVNEYTATEVPLDIPD